MDYRSSGVNISAGDQLVEKIKPLAWATRRAGVLGGIGGFAACFDLKAGGFVDPIIVTSTDGVGTKLLIALAANKLDTIGIDLVAMCVNDLIVQGATPLSFLDYYATGKLNVETASEIISGIAQGCTLAGCTLAGGETAEMPNLYVANDFDLAGFAMGAVEREALLPRRLDLGDVLIGVASSGLHSNGFSLVRQVLQSTNINTDAELDFAPGQTLGDILLTPTRIYVNAVLALHHAGLLKAAAHITGGGLPGNLPRILPETLTAVIDQPWKVPPIFSWLSKNGDIDEAEMLRTFNCGVGMVFVVSPKDCGEAITLLTSWGEDVFYLGKLEANNGFEMRVKVF